MARGRMLNKTISASMKFHQLSSDTCRLLATWIIPHLDKNGVYYGEAALVRSYIFPMREDVDIEQTERFLQELEQVGLMRRYQANGRTWQHWPGFDENQVGLRKDREGTDFPDPPSECQGDAGELPDNCRKDAGELPAEEKGSKGKSKGSEDNDLGADAPNTTADYQMIRKAWGELFPDKPQPRADNQTLQSKVKTRMKSVHFRDNWLAAMEHAAESTFLLEGSWFTLGWFLKNDDNYEKCLNGNYDDRGGKKGGTRQAGSKRTLPTEEDAAAIRAQAARQRAAMEGRSPATGPPG